MNVMHRRCAGLDVHKESISACVLIATKGKRGTMQVERQTFGTLTGDLHELKQWLQHWRVTHVALSSVTVAFHDASEMCSLRCTNRPCACLQAR
jgi:transposase